MACLHLTLDAVGRIARRVQVRQNPLRIPTLSMAPSVQTIQPAVWSSSSCARAVLSASS